MAEGDTHHDDAMESGHGDGHGHAVGGEPLGPVDLTAWVYALAGSLLGLVVILALYLAGGG
jgi:hypothetical protein